MQRSQINIEEINSSECDICKGKTKELKNYNCPNSILGNADFMICNYCYNSIMSIFYNNDDTNDIKRHVNNMVNLLESRIISKIKELNICNGHK